MLFSKSLLAGIIFCLLTLAQAGVREVILNEKIMSQVKLKMGQSTVLRFKEKPKKAIIGNKNYFNIEFVENDITLQPLGLTSTNLFIYGEKSIYGLNLRVVPTGDYDDLLIFVPKINVPFALTKKDELIQRLFYIEAIQVYVLDVTVPSNKIDLKIYQDKNPVVKQFFIISPNSKWARIFFKGEGKFLLKGTINNRSFQVAL